jgi:thiol-disulfide isomerase/thioredoxin
MKKKLIILLLVAALLPMKVFAKSFIDDYNTLNFKETLTAEGMTIENKDYKEDDKQAVIYMFRGDGCSYCRAFLTFLNSISKEYGKYFRLVSFEVWSDAKNSELLNKVPLVTNQSAGGVPYVIIGEKVFPGYASSYDEDIKSAIMAQYNDPSYDVMEKLDEQLNGNSNNGGSSFATIFWNAFFVIAAAVAIIVVNNKNTQRVLDAVGTKKNSKK